MKFQPWKVVTLSICFFSLLVILSYVLFTFWQDSDVSHSFTKANTCSSSLLLSEPPLPTPASAPVRPIYLRLAEFGLFSKSHLVSHWQKYVTTLVIIGLLLICLTIVISTMKSLHLEIEVPEPAPEPVVSVPIYRTPLFIVSMSYFIASAVFIIVNLQLEHSFISREKWTNVFAFSVFFLFFAPFYVLSVSITWLIFAAYNHLSAVCKSTQSTGLRIIIKIASLLLLVVSIPFYIINAVCSLFRYIIFYAFKCAFGPSLKIDIDGEKNTVVGFLQFFTVMLSGTFELWVSNETDRFINISRPVVIQLYRTSPQKIV